VLPGFAGFVVYSLLLFYSSVTKGKRVFYSDEEAFGFAKPGTFFSSTVVLTKG
jgi:hypothetical protein